VSLQPSAPHKGRRWLALFAIVILATGAFAGSALASPTFVFVEDQSGANDVPGQKDLTAQASAYDGSTFYTAWKWDDTSWSGKNTGDGCSLFDSDGDGYVNYAVCVTIIGKTPTLVSTTVYSCSDGRKDRCTQPVLLNTSTSYCTIDNNVTGPFDTSDTQATCNISAIATALSISDLSGSNLVNTCSYPSQEPNSDPSDCVLLVPALTDTTVSTTSSGSITWQATLNDTATALPATAGSVTFKLYSGTPCSDDATTGNLVATSTDTTYPWAATAVVINSTDVTGSGPWTYYWSATYNPAAGFNGDSELCSEATTITASVVGHTSP
jgi:hypothetical protein